MPQIFVKLFSSIFFVQEHEDASKGELFDLFEENSTEGTELNHEYNFPCDQCEFIAPQSRDLKRHKRHRHQTKKVLSEVR